MLELLLAIFILGIGLIMVSALFPVGANWTRQATEVSISQLVARQAEYLAKTRMARVESDKNAQFHPGGVLGQDPFRFNPLFSLDEKRIVNPSLFVAPNHTRFPDNPERPYPHPKNQQFDYFWTVLYRMNPVHRDPEPRSDRNITITAEFYSYDVYILVFRKTNLSRYTQRTLALRHFEVIDGLIDHDGPEYPPVVMAEYSPGYHDPSKSPSIVGAVPPIGQLGIGVESGTVFRQSVDPRIDLSRKGAGGAMPTPYLLGQSRLNGSLPTEPILFCPAPDDAVETASPLVYIYQTTLTR